MPSLTTTETEIKSDIDQRALGNEYLQTTRKQEGRVMLYKLTETRKAMAHIVDTTPVLKLSVICSELSELMLIDRFWKQPPDSLGEPSPTSM